ncbi:hypothetical protein KLP28_13355 [Nocardioidaceae bacterium]|nr:hypothetical protein KLP28_13355 [Nocardioidaceae bacterium]
MTDTARISAARTTAALVTTAGLALGGAVLSPASAATDSARDRVGDASSAPNVRPMDITGVTVRNRDRSVVVLTRFARSVKGFLIVSIDPRGGEGVRLVSQRRNRPIDEDSVVRGAFTDAEFNGDGEPEEPPAVECPGYRVTWSDDDRLARMVLPSTCLAGGDYGAIRYAALTEVGGGGDSDVAHVGRTARKDWVARG